MLYSMQILFNPIIVEKVLNPDRKLLKVKCIKEIYHLYPCVIALKNMGTSSGAYELNHECANTTVPLQCVALVCLFFESLC